MRNIVRSATRPAAQRNRRRTEGWGNSSRSLSCRSLRSKICGDTRSHIGSIYNLLGSRTRLGRNSRSARELCHRRSRRSPADIIADSRWRPVSLLARDLACGASWNGRPQTNKGRRSQLDVFIVNRIARRIGATSRIKPRHR